jgi:hypothetical protein
MASVAGARAQSITLLAGLVAARSRSAVSVEITSSCVVETRDTLQTHLANDLLVH